MRGTFYRWIAGGSVALVLALAGAVRVNTARRPHYGGTLRVEIGAVVRSLDPAEAASNPEEAATKEQIGALIYDHRNADGSFAGGAGSGAFRIAEWEPEKHLALAANSDCRAGRPFVDAIDIQMGRAAKDRLLDLDLGKADFAEIPADEARQAVEQGVRTSESQPDELIALIFMASKPAAEDARVREAVSRSIDRAAIVNFILHKEGEAAGGLLPQWSSGTAFLFSAAPDPAGARALWAQIADSPKIALGYDASDALEQMIAERIAVNARDAGISLAAKSLSGAAADFDAKLIRWRMSSPHPREALADFLAVAGPPAGLDAAPVPDPASPEQIYSRESAIVASFRVVPLARLPTVYGLGARVRDWMVPAPGEGWPLADVWLEGEAQ